MQPSPDAIAMRVERRGNRWYVVSEAGAPLGDYATEAEANERLRQVEAAKAAKATTMDSGESTESLALRLKARLDAGSDPSDFEYQAIVSELHRRGIRTFPTINQAIGRKIFMSEFAPLRSVTGYAGRVQTFDALGTDGAIRVGVWDRFATYGDGPSGLKVKDDEPVYFTPETFSAMARNWAARGQALPMCLDHRSALGGYVEAPAAALYTALAVVDAEGRVLDFKGLAGAGATPPDAAELARRCAGYPDPSPGGLWGYRAKITPKGAHPTEGLANYSGISPLFVMEGTDEQKRPIGPVLFDVAAVNVNFQGGCELTLGMLGGTRLQAMRGEENDLYRVEAGPYSQEFVGTTASEDAKKYVDYLKRQKGGLDGYMGSIRLVDALNSRQLGKWRYGSDGKWEVAFDALPAAPVTMAATDVNGAALAVGDRVRRAGREGTVTWIGSGGNKATIEIKWDGGNAVMEGSSGVFKMSAPAAQQAKTMALDANSRAWLDSVERIARTDPAKAARVIKKALADGSTGGNKEIDDALTAMLRALPRAGEMSAAPSGKGAMRMAAVGDKVRLPGTASEYRITRINDDGTCSLQSTTIASDVRHKVPIGDLVAMSATGAPRAFSSTGAKMNEQEMAAHFGFEPDDDDAKKMAKVMAKCMAEGAPPFAGKETPEEEQAEALTAMDVDPSNKEQDAAIHLKTGNVQDEGGKKKASALAALDEDNAISALVGKLGAANVDTAGKSRAQIFAMAALHIGAAPDEAKVSALVDARLAQIRAADTAAVLKRDGEAIVSMARVAKVQGDDLKAIALLAQTDPALARTQLGRIAPKTLATPIALGMRFTAGGDPVGKEPMQPTNLGADDPDDIEARVVKLARDVMAADKPKAAAEKRAPISFGVASAQVLAADRALAAQFKALRR